MNRNFDFARIIVTWEHYLQSEEFNNILFGKYNIFFIRDNNFYCRRLDLVLYNIFIK